MNTSRRWKTSVRFLVGVFAPSLFAFIVAAEPVVVKSIRGKSEVKRARGRTDRWSALRLGSAIKPGDEVRTSANGRTVLKLDDGSRVVLGAGSRAKVLESSPNRIFTLAVGRMKSFVKKLKPTSKFEVRTPLAAASVRGTVFEVGFDESQKRGYLDVSRGLVSLNHGDQNVDVRAGERMDFLQDVPLGDAGRSRGSDGSLEETASDEKAELKREVGLGMSKEAVMAAAAEEMRRAEYQEGKTLIDVNGDRVRLEEYVIRNPQDAFVSANPDRAFKLVVLNERENRFDYFYYLGMFNQTLPDDLSVALNDVRGKLSAIAPTYFLDRYETGQSNTQDSVLDQSTGGHQVKVTFDGTQYTLEDVNNPSETRTILADNSFTQSGETYHKIYDPVGDKFVTITQAQYEAGGGVAAAYDADTDAFRDIGAGDVYWRTAFDNYSHLINGVSKQSYVPDSGAGFTTVLARDQDALYTFAGGSVVGVVETPSGSDLLHNKITLFYGDGSWERVNTYIISDDGKIGPLSAFSGLTSGADFKDALLSWNYEQVTEAFEFQGRKIDLVVEPKILIKSGLLQ